MNKKNILPIFLSFFIFFSGCKEEKPGRIVIWTNCSEFAQYIEFFNSTHKDSNAVLVYKENPAASLPAAKDELKEIKRSLDTPVEAFRLSYVNLS